VKAFTVLRSPGGAHPGIAVKCLRSGRKGRLDGRTRLTGRGRGNPSRCLAAGVRCGDDVRSPSYSDGDGRASLAQGCVPHGVPLRGRRSVVETTWRQCWRPSSHSGGHVTRTWRSEDGCLDRPQHEAGAVPLASSGLSRDRCGPGTPPGGLPGRPLAAVDERIEGPPPGWSVRYTWRAAREAALPLPTDADVDDRNQEDGEQDAGVRARSAVAQEEGDAPRSAGRREDRWRSAHRRPALTTTPPEPCASRVPHPPLGRSAIRFNLPCSSTGPEILHQSGELSVSPRGGTSGGQPAATGTLAHQYESCEEERMVDQREGELIRLALLGAAIASASSGATTRRRARVAYRRLREQRRRRGQGPGGRDQVMVRLANLQARKGPLRKLVPRNRGDAGLQRGGPRSRAVGCR